MRVRTVVGTVLAAAVLAAGISFADGPTPVAASCSMLPNATFRSWTDVARSGITSLFEARVQAVGGPKRAPIYRLEVGRMLAGAPIRRRTIRFSGETNCGSTVLRPGARYLVALDPTRQTANASMVWRRWRGEWVGSPDWTLDGRSLPTNDRALIARLHASLPRVAELTREAAPAVAGPTWTPTIDRRRGPWITFERVIAWRRGFAALGQTPRGIALWTSRDGDRWTRYELPIGPGLVSRWAVPQRVLLGQVRLLTHRGRLLVVTTAGTVRVLSSGDGRHWRLLPADRDIASGALFHGVDQVLSAGDTLLAIGGVVPPCEGIETCPRFPRTWRSSDGVHWQAIPNLTTGYQVMRAGQGRFLAILGGTNQRRDRWLMGSRDGLRWHRITVVPRDLDVTGIAETSAGVIVQADHCLEDGSTQAGVWRWDGGPLWRQELAWISSEGCGPWGARDLAVSGERIVAVADATPPPLGWDGMYLGTGFMSLDGGRTWRQMATAPGPRPCFDTVALRGRRVVVEGDGCVWGRTPDMWASTLTARPVSFWPPRPGLRFD